MTIVEQHRKGKGFQWADPLTKGAGLELKQVGAELHISGLLPLYETNAGPSDLVRQYEVARKHLTIGQQRTGKKSPHIRFANADTDDKLIAFAQQFGPVVAKYVYDNYQVPEPGLPEPRWPPRLTAHQDIQELRNERLIYRAALTLVMDLARPNFDFLAAQHCIGEIAAKMSDWPRQWEREQSESKREPSWKLKPESLERIEGLSSGSPGLMLPPNLDGRIVICELLNVFRSSIYPNLSEMHSSIRYGIRPLLYSLLRREFLYPRDVAVCANDQCREFFEVERAGQQFCSAECSLHQRQRDYWKKRGKKLRETRVKKQSKAGR